MVLWPACASASGVNVFVGSPTIPSLAGPTSANLFVDTNGGSCTRSSSPTTYVDANACSSLQAAYTACQSGDTINVRAGSYGDQTIGRSARTGPSPCTFQETNGNVTLASLSVLADWVTFDGFDVTNGVDMDDNVDGLGSISNRIYNVSFHNVHMLDGLYLANTENTTVTGGEICCKYATLANQTKTINMAGQINGDPATANTNLTLDGVSVHDNTREDGSVHTECMFAMAVQTLTIRNSKFYNCQGYNISLGRIGSDLDPSNTLIENTAFFKTDDVAVGDKAGRAGSISLGHVTTRFQNLTFRNDSFGESIALFNNTDDACSCDTPTGAYSLTHFYSNLLELTGARCSTPSQSAGQPDYDYNVVDISDSQCGTHKTVVADVSALYSSYAGNDYHLLTGSSAIGAGAPSNSTATDIGGHARDGSPDAGAYEFGSGS